MFAKHALATAAATLAIAALPAISPAETQTEWLQQQLQITDGYTPPPAAAAPRKEKYNKESPFEGTGLKEKIDKPVPTPNKTGGFRFLGDGRIFTGDGIEVSP